MTRSRLFPFSQKRVTHGPKRSRPALTLLLIHFIRFTTCFHLLHFFSTQFASRSMGIIMLVACEETKVTVVQVRSIWRYSGWNRNTRVIVSGTVIPPNGRWWDRVAIWVNPKTSFGGRSFRPVTFIDTHALHHTVPCVVADTCRYGAGYLRGTFIVSWVKPSAVGLKFGL